MGSWRRKGPLIPWPLLHACPALEQWHQTLPVALLSRPRSLQVGVLRVV